MTKRCLSLWCKTRDTWEKKYNKRKGDLMKSIKNYYQCATEQSSRCSSGVPFVKLLPVRE